MSDVTNNFASIYLALKRCFDDLNRLGSDFGEALRRHGHEFTESEEYSHSPNSLVLKKSHAWLFHFPIEEGLEKALTFASCFTYFEADRKLWKATPPGCPELWFFIGTTTPVPTVKKASLIQTFFDTGDLSFYDTKPSLGGKVARYTCRDPERWDAVCMGFEMGAINSPETLERLAVEPLLDAAAKTEIL